MPGVQRDINRRIPDSQDPLDTGAQGSFIGGSVPDSKDPLDTGTQGSFIGGSQTVRILWTLVPGVQRDFHRRIPDSQDPLDTGARGAEGLS